MNQHVDISPREHHFFVAISKFLFYHPKHGVVLAQDPIKTKDAEQYSLNPLILYGLTVAGLPIKWMTFTPLEQPRALRDVLQEAWCYAEGLRGRPDILRISRHLATASPTLVQEMAQLGVRVEIADAKNKHLPASLRTSQESSRWLLMRYGKKTGTRDEDIQALCQCAQYDHSSDVSHTYISNRSMKEKLKLWLSLPVLELGSVSTNGLDWELGSWLSSWEIALPPNPPRHFKLDFEYGGAWLMTGEKAPDLVDDDDDEDFWAESYNDNVADIAKNLVECWPNPSVEIAKAIGTTLRELQWFLAGKAPLEQDGRFNLENLLGIQYDERMGEYTGVGPYVLMAKKIKALEESYITISHGGDARPYEIIPNGGTADPSWRYVLINTYGKPLTIVMSPRGEKITERLPSLLMNYAGIVPVPLEFYRDVAATCARACREPMANIHEMMGFAHRYETTWGSRDWLSS